MGGWSSTKYSDYNWSRSKKVTKKSAKSYTNDDGRVYQQPTRGKSPIGTELKTESDLAAILMVDVTGSMRNWPEIIFDRLPVLYGECNAALQGQKVDELEKGKKIDPKLELGVLAIGDAYCDRYPLQATKFCKGPELVKEVKNLYPEGGGGGNEVESYDLGLYYLLNHCETPNVKKPLLVIAGDEGFYKTVKKEWVERHTGDKIAKDIDTKEMIEKVKEKFDLYVIRPEPGSYSEGTYNRIHQEWQEAVGHEKVLRMESPWDIVNCIVGIAAYKAGNFEEGINMLKRRETPEEVRNALKALHPLLEKETKEKK